MANYLVAQGVIGQRLVVNGFGETQPVTSNATRSVGSRLSVSAPSPSGVLGTRPAEQLEILRVIELERRVARDSNPNPIA